MSATDVATAASGTRIRALSRLSIISSVLIVFAGPLQVAISPKALAEPIDNARAAVMQARGGSCGALRSEPLVERAAYLVNQSIDGWIDHTIRFAPIDKPLPILKDLGYPGGKAAMALGASKNEADAIKGMLLEAWAAIPDCSYSDYGVSILMNKSRNEFLTAVVVAGA